MPQFSVVIPLYNKAEHIAATLQTVLDQTFRDFEVVIVDDGSTDGSAEIVERVASGHVRLVRQKNGGVSAARNRGIKEAAGSYIAFLDADDEWTPEHLAELARLIEEFPGLGLYSAAYDIVRDGVVYQHSQPVPDGYFGIIENFLLEYSRNFALAHSSTACIPSELFKEIGGFPEGIRKGEDVIIWIKAALAGKMAYSTKVCTRHNLDASNRSDRIRDDMIPYYIVWLDEELHNGGAPKAAGQVLFKAILTNAAGSRLAGDRQISPNYKKLHLYSRLSIQLSLWLISITPQGILQFLRNNRRRIRRTVDV